jgi:hypothetical protein
MNSSNFSCQSRCEIPDEIEYYDPALYPQANHGHYKRDQSSKFDMTEISVPSEAPCKKESSSQKTQQSMFYLKSQPKPDLAIENQEMYYKLRSRPGDFQ